MECRRIGADRKLNANFTVGGVGLIVLLKSAAHFARLDANNWVVPGCVARWAEEDFGSYGAFFQ